MAGSLKTLPLLNGCQIGIIPDFLFIMDGTTCKGLAEWQLSKRVFVDTGNWFLNYSVPAFYPCLHVSRVHSGTVFSAETRYGTRARKFEMANSIKVHCICMRCQCCRIGLQIQGESEPGKLNRSGTANAVYRGMLSTAVGIVREEGPLKLWQGATPAIYRHIVYSGGRMLAYEQLRDNILGKAEDGSFPVWKAALCGMVSGALGQFLASPTDLVKVQMQMEGKRRLEGKPPRAHGVIHAFGKIMKEGGIRGLWAGWVPNVQRAALVNLGDLTTYDSVKHSLLRNTSIGDNCLCHGIASTCSGLVAAMMGTPADVVKTRIMNQPRDSNGRGLLYKSSIDCLVQSIRREGLLTLYKGFVPTWLRMAPWSMTFWLSFEQIRHAVGISSF